MPQILIVADDLTGAADTGAPFAEAGWLTLIIPVPGGQGRLEADARFAACDALAVSTQSRDLAREEATAQVRQEVCQLKGEGGTSYIYKKIDSTLRGHPGPELAALMDALDLEGALVAPAFPAQGRTTVGGQQLVEGCPLERTTFGQEVPSSDLLALFQVAPVVRPARLVELEAVRRGQDAICEALDAAGSQVIVADAETAHDLTTIAGAGLRCGVRLWCGSAGLARALADALPRPPGSRSLPEPPRGPAGPILVVAGSRQTNTARQVDVARGWGAAVIRPDPAALRSEAGAIELIVRQASRRLAGNQHVILTTAGLGDSPRGNQAVADGLAMMARRLAIESEVGGLILTGGDIASAVCAALEADVIWLRGEIQPGIAWGILLDGLVPGLPVVTKAGGFGADEALAVAIRKLEDWKIGKLVNW